MIVTILVPFNNVASNNAEHLLNDGNLIVKQIGTEKGFELDVQINDTKKLQFN